MSEHSPAVGLSLCTPVSRPVLAPALTTEEIDAYARYLAWELDYDQVRACDHRVGWYQQQLNSDVCSFSDAAALRLRVMYLCREESLRRKRESPAASLVGMPQIQLHPRTADTSLFSRMADRVCAGVDQHYEVDRLTRKAIVRVLASTVTIALLVYAAISCCAGRF